jgi:hypothetical protein
MGSKEVNPLRGIPPDARATMKNPITSAVDTKDLSLNSIQYDIFPRTGKHAAASEARSSRKNAVCTSTGVGSALNSSISLCEGGME